MARLSTKEKRKEPAGGERQPARGGKAGVLAMRSPEQRRSLLPNCRMINELLALPAGAASLGGA